LENFIFCNPTKIIFGQGTDKNVGELIKPYADKILFLYDIEAIKNNGAYERIIESLNSANIGYIELTGVKPNPRLKLVKEGIELCRKEKIDFILAVGGGSVIDTAKAIGIGVDYDGDVWDYFMGKTKVTKTVPVGVILTIPASGSESSATTVITNEEGLYKRDVVTGIILPKFAILNPELTYTLPVHQTAAGATDIISHVLERYFTSVSNVDLTDRLCEATIKTVIRNVYVAIAEPENYDGRAEIMWAGSIAHNDLLGTGRIADWATHSIGVEISAIYDIAHGETLSIIFPAWMKYVYKKYAERFAQYAVRVWNSEIYFNSIEKVALEGIKKTEDFFKSIDMPVTLKEAGISSERFDEMASKATERGLIGNLVKLGKNDVLNILDLAK